MSLNRRTFLLSTAAAAAATPPNILFLMPDQWRGCDLGSMGNTQVRTPHLDRMAREGVQFTNAMANEPVCCAARAVLLTGKYPHAAGVAANDVPLPEDQTTIAQVLAKRDYATGFIGKWHLQGGQRLPGFVPPGARRFGFDYWAANICDHRCYDTHYFRDDPKPIPVRGYDTFAFTDCAMDFMTQAKRRQQPFCLYWQPTPPHNPYKIPPGFEGKYKASNVKLRPNWKAGAKQLGTAEDIANYYAAIECLDGEVGRLLAKVEELGLRDNTIVYFLSDHGDMLGSHGTFLKRKPWEESVRVPSIFRWPGRMKAGTRLSQPFSHVDVVPTLLGLASAAGSDAMQGFDYSPVLLGRKTRTPEMAFIGNHTQTEAEEFPPWRGVRTERYKYARFRDKRWVLYDLKTDPYELTNLAAQPKFEKLMSRFDKAIDGHMDRTKDDWEELKDDLRIYDPARGGR